jgi:hypothetical protein
MFNSRDTFKTESHNNGSSTQSPRHSRTITGSLTHSTSKDPMLDANQLLQDGGNCSRNKVNSLSMRKVRS